MIKATSRAKGRNTFLDRCYYGSVYLRNHLQRSALERVPVSPNSEGLGRGPFKISIYAIRLKQRNEINSYKVCRELLCWLDSVFADQAGHFVLCLSETERELILPAYKWEPRTMLLIFPPEPLRWQNIFSGLTMQWLVAWIYWEGSCFSSFA